MARDVPPWTWAIALRDHGPDDRLLLLIMHTLRTFMDKSGFAYPGRSTLATGARVHVKTIGRQLAKAQAAGWIRVEPYGHAGGQKWRTSTYRATVPDHIVLGARSEEVEDFIQSPPSGQAESAMQSPPFQPAEDKSALKVGANGAKVGANGAKVGAPRSPTNSHLELSNLNSQKSEGRLPPTKRAIERESKSLDQEELKRRVKAALSRWPEHRENPDKIADLCGASRAQVQPLLAEAAA